MLQRKNQAKIAKEEPTPDLKTQVEQITFDYTKSVLGGRIDVVFYDMTTLYFESPDEDDFRKTGFSKDGKHQNPQIFLGLLAGMEGNAIGYEIFEGNIFEGNTFIPLLKRMENGEALFSGSSDCNRRGRTSVQNKHTGS